MAETINALDPKWNIRYAHDQEEFEAALITESGTIPPQTRVATTTPTYLSEFDEVLGLGPSQVQWASIEPPPNYFASRRRLFSAEGLIPSLGMLEAPMERIKAMPGPSDPAIAKEAGPSDKETIFSLLQQVDISTRDLLDIIARRAQYQKG